MYDLHLPAPASRPCLDDIVERLARNNDLATQTLLQARRDEREAVDLDQLITAMKDGRRARSYRETDLTGVIEVAEALGMESRELDRRVIDRAGQIEADRRERERCW